MSALDDLKRMLGSAKVEFVEEPASPDGCIIAFAAEHYEQEDRACTVYFEFAADGSLEAVNTDAGRSWPTSR